MLPWVLAGSGACRHWLADGDSVPLALRVLLNARTRNDMRMLHLWRDYKSARIDAALACVNVLVRWN